MTRELIPFLKHGRIDDKSYPMIKRHRNGAKKKENRVISVRFPVAKKLNRSSSRTRICTCLSREINRRTISRLPVAINQISGSRDRTRSAHRFFFHSEKINKDASPRLSPILLFTNTRLYDETFLSFFFLMAK